MPKRNPRGNKDEKAISRFRVAIIIATHLNHKLAGYIQTRGQKNSRGPVPPELLVEWMAALKELTDSSADALKIFKIHKIDASAIFQLLNDAHLVRYRESFHDAAAHAALDNLRLHISPIANVIRKRLSVVIREDNGIAVLDGLSYPITKLQATVLQKLLDAGGVWVPGWEIRSSKYPDSRPDKLFARLPSPLRKIIDTKPGKGGGTRLNL